MVLFTGVKEGAIFIDNTTASAKIARELKTEATKKKVWFFRCSCFRRTSGSRKWCTDGHGWRDQTDYDKAEPVIDCYAKKIKLLGSSGSGQLAKMVNQICIAGLVQGLSEAIRFGQNAGLNMEDVIEVISKGAAQSWQMENRYKTMITDKFDYGFAVDWMEKRFINWPWKKQKIMDHLFR